MEGTKIGYWLILGQSDINKRKINQKERRHWNIKCLLCGEEFIKSTKDIRILRNYPVSCPGCKVKKGYVSHQFKTHWKDAPCGAKSWFIQDTEILQQVNCARCKSMIDKGKILK